MYPFRWAGPAESNHEGRLQAFPEMGISQKPTLVHGQISFMVQKIVMMHDTISEPSIRCWYGGEAPALPSDQPHESSIHSTSKGELIQYQQ